MCASAPDTSGQQQAALMTAQLSKEQLEWAKQIYAETAPQRAAAEGRAGEVSDMQLASGRQQMGLADEYADYNRRVFRPLEESIVSDAKNFDTEAKREELAGLALGDVNQQFGAARATATRDMSRMGVNPADGKFGATNTQLTLGQALAGADAQNKARANAITLASAKKMDAASLGRGLPGNQATAASLAMSQGNSSVGNANAALAPGQQAQAMLGSAYSGARQGYGQSANIYGNIANTEAGVDSANDSTMAGLGAAAGTIAVVI